MESTDGNTAACADAHASHHSHSRDDAEALVLRVIASDADSLLRLARRHSLCADDAQDAYQRGLEIFMRHAHPVIGKRGAALGSRRESYGESKGSRRVRASGRGIAPAGNHGQAPLPTGII